MKKNLESFYNIRYALKKCNLMKFDASKNKKIIKISRPFLLCQEEWIMQRLQGYFQKISHGSEWEQRWQQMLYWSARGNE